MFNNQNSSIEIQPKSNGSQFGSIINVEKQGTYYAKVHQEYPIKNYKNQKQVNTDDGAMTDNSDFGSNSNSIIDLNHLLNLKEPFVYKVFELLGLEPQVNFIINPFINYGFYIVSKKLDDFVEMEKINYLSNFSKDMKLTFGLIRSNIINRSEIELGEQLKRNAFIGLSELDIVNRLFTLRDFNTYNFGFLKEGLKFEPCSWLDNQHKFMIIDFMPSSKGNSNYIVKDIGPTFVEGNSITKYKSGTIMYYAINRKIDDDKNENIKKKEIIKKEKAHFETCFPKQFHERLQNFLNTKQIDNDFEDDKSTLQKLLETAYDEIQRLKTDLLITKLL